MHGHDEITCTQRNAYPPFCNRPFAGTIWAASLYCRRLRDSLLLWRVQEDLDARIRKHNVGMTSLQTHLLATLAVLPLLVAQDGRAALLSCDTLALLERMAEGPRGDLGVLVVPVGCQTSNTPHAWVGCGYIRENVAPVRTAHRSG